MRVRRSPSGSSWPVPNTDCKLRRSPSPCRIPAPSRRPRSMQNQPPLRTSSAVGPEWLRQCIRRSNSLFRTPRRHPSPPPCRNTRACTRRTPRLARSRPARRSRSGWASSWESCNDWGDERHCPGARLVRRVEPTPGVHGVVVASGYEHDRGSESWRRRGASCRQWARNPAHRRIARTGASCSWRWWLSAGWNSRSTLLWLAECRESRREHWPWGYRRESARNQPVDWRPGYSSRGRWRAKLT